jgi:hypothetical protein
LRRAMNCNPSLARVRWHIPIQITRAGDDIASPTVFQTCRVTVPRASGRSDALQWQSTWLEIDLANCLQFPRDESRFASFVASPSVSSAWVIRSTWFLQTRADTCSIHGCISGSPEVEPKRVLRAVTTADCLTTVRTSTIAMRFDM